jgi:hypothetical protein
MTYFPEAFGSNIKNKDLSANLELKPVPMQLKPKTENKPFPQFPIAFFLPPLYDLLNWSMAVPGH